MKILRAIGLAIGIVVLKTLMPEVFEAIEHTLLTFLSVLSEVLSHGAGSLTATPPNVIEVPRI